MSDTTLKMSDTTATNVAGESNPQQQFTPEQQQYYQQQYYQQYYHQQYYNFYKNNPHMNPYSQMYSYMNPYSQMYPMMNPIMNPPIYPQIQPNMYPSIQPISVDTSVSSTNKNMIVSIVKEDGKLICKRSYACTFGMKCTNKDCSDYHHPKVDLDIIKEGH